MAEATIQARPSAAGEALASAEELLRGGRFADARRAYERIVERGESSAFVCFRLGLIALQDQRLDDARMLLDEAVAGEPRNAEHHYVLGRVHKALDSLAAAEAAHREALRLRPSYVDAWVSLGTLLKQL